MAIQRITVLGASGQVGRQLVTLALSNGLEVRALVHNHNPFQDEKLFDPARLTVLHGDVNQPADIVQALAGSQAVISTLGSWHGASKTVLSDAMRNLIPAMQTTGIGRVISLTGSGARCLGDAPSKIHSLSRAILSVCAPGILRDGETHLQLLAASGLDWTCLRSPVMTRGTVRSYRLWRSFSVSALYATVPRQAVAQALIDQLDATDHIGQAPFLSR